MYSFRIYVLIIFEFVVLPNSKNHTPKMAQSRSWCFTLNNFSTPEYDSILSLADTDDVEYLCCGKEVGENGTPHLQGFIIFSSSRRFRSAKSLISNRAHVERARGSANQASEYCKKDGDFIEVGSLPGGRTANRGQFDVFVEWVKGFWASTGRTPGERDIALQFPALYCRYSRNLKALADYNCPPAVIQDGDLRAWQSELHELIVNNEPDDRIINFVIDPEGGKGKSFFYRWFYSKYPEKTQLLSVGKRDDLAHALDVTKSVFLFNVPRGGMEHLQYTILEQIKDKVIFSPKYNSQTKLLYKNAHVVVFCNEEPDHSKMTEDRFNSIRI
jgi:hypothetical protein